MGINVKHTPAAVTFAAPAYLAGQEDLRRHMEKMDQQRAEMMLKAQQAREENAVKIAMQDAQINAQANNQRAGQMHDFQRMQFGAGLNAAQDKVNFDQQQAIQKAGQNFQAAENKKAQDAIAARMEQARQDQADAKAEYIKQQQEAAKKAEDQKQQDRLNALPVQTSRQIQEQNRSNALLSSIDVATGGMIPDVVKYDAANIINTQQSQKTPQQVARDTLLQTHDYSPADAKKMADAERKMAAIQAAIIEPEKKRAMLQPLEDLIQNTMPSVRRPKLSEQVEVDNNGATLSRAKDGSVKRTSPEKLNDVDKKYEVGQKAYDAATRLPGMTEERAKAIEAEAMQGYERDQQKSRELTIRVAKGEDEGKVRAELEQKYRSVAPVPQPAAPATAPQAPDQVKANNQHDQQAYAARERQLLEAGASPDAAKVQMKQWQESRDMNYRKAVDAVKGAEKLLSPRDGDFRPAPYELQRQGVVGEIPAGRGPMQLRQYNTQGIPVVVDAKGLEPGTLYAVVENGKIAYKRKGVTKETLQPTPQ